MGFRLLAIRLLRYIGNWLMVIGYCLNLSGPVRLCSGQALLALRRGRLARLWRVLRALWGRIIPDFFQNTSSFFKNLLNIFLCLLNI